MARFGDGMATGADLADAADRAADAALAGLGGRRPDLACVFVSGGDPDEVAAAGMRAMRRCAAPASIGCSGPGVLASGGAVEAANAVAVWCAVLPGVRVRTFHLEVMPASEGMAVVGLPERAPDDAVGVLLADPWSFPVDGFVTRANEALTGLPFVGGCATGWRGRGSTRLFINGEVADRGAVGAMLAGPVGARAFVSQGCRPIGPAMTVTASDGNVLLELAGVPVLDKLEQIVLELDPATQALATTGLQVGIAIDEYADEHGAGDFLVRGIAGGDPERRGLIVADLVPVGRTVQFQLRDAAAADDDLRQTLRAVRSSALDSIEGALLFTCNGRGGEMFTSADHDVVVVGEELAVDAVAGFFAAGEIGPVGGRNHMHGMTASMLAFGSGPASDRGTTT
jgi:small ligand-binding sensory domain FIST